MEAKKIVLGFIVWCLAFYPGSLHVKQLKDKTFDDLLSLSSTSTWKEFPLEQDVPFKEEKWVWISSITFKSKEAFKLKKINIQWLGKKIDSLSAALFSKRRKEPCVIPIEDNLVCDGVWDKHKQQIIFSLNKKIVATNSYHLVLSFPGNVESSLKKGKFKISKKNLLSISP